MWLNGRGERKKKCAEVRKKCESALEIFFWCVKKGVQKV